MTIEQITFENIVGKGEIAGKTAFSPFPTMFSTLSNINSISQATLKLWSANAYNLVLSKILLFCNELTFYKTTPCFYVSAAQVF